MNRKLRVFDADTGGSPAYAEQHLGVPLDATRDFSVQLGVGANPSGSFDAEFAAFGGHAAASTCCSGSTLPGFPTHAWTAFFHVGDVGVDIETLTFLVDAVRAGSGY